MITEQQKNALTPGDIVLIRGTFNRLDEEGDLEISHSYTPHTGAAIATTSSYADRTCVELPPRPPSTRRFKKGDLVRLVEWNGRSIDTFDESTMWASYGKKDATFVVTEDEIDGRVEAEDPQEARMWVVVHPCHLELVTPAEDRAPWRIGELKDSFFVGHDGTMAAKFKKDGHPDARAAAIAERDRLNASYIAAIMQH